MVKKEEKHSNIEDIKKHSKVKEEEKDFNVERWSEAWNKGC